MSLDLALSWWIVARLIIYALLLVLLVRGLRVVLALAPMSALRRRSLQQAFPIVELLLGVLYVVAAVRELFSGWPEAVAVLGIVFGGLWVARYALMDILTGVLLRTAGNVARGDRVQLEGLDGRVTWLGNRVLAIETRGGDEALIPYSLLSRQAVVRTPLVEGAHRYSFRLTEAVPPERVRQLALLCHWSAVARQPVIEFGPDGSVEVTVFAVAADRGPEIEAFVRRALSQVSPG